MPELSLPEKQETTQTDLSPDRLVTPTVQAEGLSGLGSIAEFSSHAQKLDRYALLNTARKLLPHEKIAECQYAIAPLTDVVTVTHDGERAKYCGLVNCESPSCPFCSYGWAEEKRHELSVALAQAERKGWQPALVTFTLSHRWGDSLAATLSALTEAYNLMFSGRWYQWLKSEWLLKHKIKSQEVTIGKNGWHPHLHCLFFFEIDLDIWNHMALQNTLAERWQECLDKLGYFASREHGVDVRTADSDIADYIAKFGKEPRTPEWGAEHELTHSRSKKAQLQGMTPFEILAAAAGDMGQIKRFQAFSGTSDPDVAKKRCERLYVEYFMAMKGRSRNHWSKNLWDDLDMDAALDWIAQMSMEPEPEPETLVTMSRAAWRVVRGAKGGDDYRSELLAVCSARDPYALWHWFFTTMGADLNTHWHIPEMAYVHFERRNNGNAK